MDKSKENTFIITSLKDLENAIKVIEEQEIKKATFVPIMQKEKYFAGYLEKLKELKTKDIDITFQYRNSNERISLEEVIEDEEFLNSIVKEIQEKNFSPLEKLIAVYDIVKGIKPYNIGYDENGNMKEVSSRGLYEILKNKDIVCVGFVSLMINLCYRLGLDVVSYPLVRQSEYDHNILYVHLKDEKYDIDGYYTLDPTDEHSGKIEILDEFPFEVAKSQYDSFLLTTSETKQKFIRDGLDFISFDDVFRANSPEEVLNTLKQIKRLTTYSNEIEAYVIAQIDAISELDPSLMKILKKYKSPFYYPNEADSIELFNLIHEKFNKDMDRTKLLEAIINVKKTIYKNFSEQDFEDMKMLYSIYPPFAKTDENGNILESLYGNEFLKYAGRRYLQLKDLNERKIEEDNPCLAWAEISQCGKMAIRHEIYSQLEESYRKSGIEQQDLQNSRQIIEKTSNMENDKNQVEIEEDGENGHKY